MLILSMCRERFEEGMFPHLESDDKADSFHPAGFPAGFSAGIELEPIRIIESQRIGLSSVLRAANP
ncbi:hypothetical protein CLOSTMETH_02394 [[Clostridium] methylpentosum DSM 5476]|uniref:Uncharacterized protein n=1 Tax=[Clostridium] methylpentosum DSM 5476 TaxID=537013 RepID=C0EEV5_9FIRM|nr:hypothetical protein CLOSTMETH_02394 [[Clostridium] methylpentosum DSM 5476]